MAQDKKSDERRVTGESLEKAPKRAQGVEHTPTPWKSDTFSGFILANNGDIVCQFWSKAEEDYANDEANAEFIVRACNNFEPLLAAAAKVLEGLNARIDDAGYKMQPVPLFDGIAELHEAIAKASGAPVASPEGK